MPSCFVAPKSTQDVLKIVKLLSLGSCHFAIRSGGHGLLVGSSNIAVGVTIDMSGMDSVVLIADKTTASVQPGAKWIHVYETLDSLGYAIPGGRAGDVGVGGLTSGGMSILIRWCRWGLGVADDHKEGTRFLQPNMGLSVTTLRILKCVENLQ